MVPLTTSSSAFAVLDRQKTVIRQVLSGNGPTSESCEWKILVCDSEAHAIVSSLFTSSELRSFGVTLNTMIDSHRGPVHGTPAIYLIAASPQNVALVTRDISPKSMLYQRSSVGFLTAVSRALLTALATQLPVPSPLTNIYDLHSHFLSLEQNLFTLNINRSYAYTIRAAQDESVMRSFVETVVNGLFSVLITLGVIPIIRAQRGGPAQKIASALDTQIRDHLDLFQRVSISSRALSFRRPLLLLLDRSFDFNSILYHTWTYQALVHDCLDMSLNQVSVDIPSSENNRPETKKTYVLDKSTDSFWDTNASKPFPVVAESVETALTQYRENVDRINKRSTGSSSDTTERSDSYLETSDLAQAISSLPELSHQKEIINTHTNIATMLLNNINTRSLDTFFELESQLMRELHRPLASQSPDAYKAAITKLLRSDIDDDESGSQKRGCSEDRLRMFLIYYDVFGDRFSAGDVSEYKALLQASGADVSIINYIANLKGYQHDVVAPASPSNGKLNTATLTRLMNRMVHRGYRSITNVAQSAKKLVSDQATKFAVARTLEVFMTKSARDRHPTLASEILEDYLLFDPKLMPSAGSLRPKIPSVTGSSIPENSSQRKMQNLIFSDSIVFTIGGGNYVEFENCIETISKDTSNGRAPNLLYGTTEMITAKAFLSQLGEVAKDLKNEELD